MSINIDKNTEQKRCLKNVNTRIWGEKMSDVYLSDHSDTPTTINASNAMNLAISAAFSAGRIHKDMFKSVNDSGFPKKSIHKKSQTSKRQPH